MLVSGGQREGWDSAVCGPHGGEYFVKGWDAERQVHRSTDSARHNAWQR